MLEKWRRWRSIASVICCAVAMLSLAGCGKGPRRVPASGSIELDGKPLQGGILFFNPDLAKGNMARVSCTSPIRNGRFEVQTAGIERSESGPGIPLGWYKVSLRVNLLGQPPVFPGQPVIDVNPVYLDPVKTKLAIEVVDNPAPGTYDLKLSSYSKR